MSGLGIHIRKTHADIPDFMIWFGIMMTYPRHTDHLIGLVSFLIYHIAEGTYRLILQIFPDSLRSYKLQKILTVIFTYIILGIFGECFYIGKMLSSPYTVIYLTMCPVTDSIIIIQIYIIYSSVFRRKCIDHVIGLGIDIAGIFGQSIPDFTDTHCQLLYIGRFIISAVCHGGFEINLQTEFLHISCGICNILRNGFHPAPEPSCSDEDKKDTDDNGGNTVDKYGNVLFFKLPVIPLGIEIHSHYTGNISR